MSKQLYIDLDGVLADFDGHYSKTFNFHIDRSTVDPPGFWANIESCPGFYRSLPILPDAKFLWSGAKLLHPRPIVLTGIPYSIPDVVQHKREWLNEHIGCDAAMIACESKDKRLHCARGDVLIDDWVKYRHLWEEAGGQFILHTPGKSEVSLALAAQALEVISIALG